MTPLGKAEEENCRSPHVGHDGHSAVETVEPDDEGPGIAPATVDDAQD